ncbi:hypothetical protein N1495_06730 [Streptococcus didelphis]|uniref:DUF2642 domain-containing protein n=1 Tax=Streptococcus didelphis TaxID=102886 RepID=A0ABY9LHZ1_9STRE|nr:hypothetical protein [Streptococcus didelphis]WMB28448.1 hypothetical protein N1496_02295 [Streptococcus didelphis]WMB29123.1 hypothetical protein N1495_06730 [Streptococcus didelphis]
MKRLTPLLKSLLYDFIEAKPHKQQDISLQSNKLIASIDKAKKSKLPIHVISKDKSFTGQLLKYDKARGLVYLKTESKSLTLMIPLADIQKISFLPQPTSKE